LLKKCFNYN